MASSGNFAVFSIVTRPESPYSTTDQITGGGLSIKGPSSGSFEPVIATISPNSGKWYWEYRAGQGGGSSYGRPSIAVSEQGVVKNEDFYGGASGITGVMFAANDGQKRINGSTSSYGNAVSQHDIVQVALDCDNGAVYFGINNTWQNSGDPTSGSSKTGAALTSGIQNVNIDIIHTRYYGGGIDQYNFGQDDTFGGAITAAGNADGNGFGVFKYSPPTGFLALCSANLPVSDDIDPAQTDDDYPSKQFNAVLYTGNGSSNAISGLGFKPDLVWGKSRSASQSHRLYDSSRGGSSMLFSDTTAAAQTGSVFMTSFDTDGFTYSSSGSNANDNTVTYVAWCWKANGGTTATNDEGSLDSTVQANTKAGFSIVETPNFTGSCTLGHGLTKAPEFVIHKLTASGNNWNVWHTGLSGAGYIIRLNTTAAETTGSHFNSTAPTADVFSLGASLAGSGAGICYLWHSVEGYSKFGTYVGNYNTDGTFIYTGFRPRMLFVKRSDAVNSWFVWDTERTTFNKMNSYLYWDLSNGEETGYAIDVLSNGFKLRGQNNATNNSGGTFIYGAWGDVPFKYNNTF